MVHRNPFLAILLLTFPVIGIVGKCGARCPGSSEHELTLEGQEDVDTLHIPLDTVVHITEDLDIHSRGQVLLEGSIVARRRQETGNVSGVSVSIRSNEAIIVLGDILAGTGSTAYEGPSTLENCAMIGGKGGDVTLRAPVILINGRVIGGEGGYSGPNAEAPAGGRVLVEGVQFTTRDVARLPEESSSEYRWRLSSPGGVGLFGGQGGSHISSPAFSRAFAPGGGGRGGDVKCARMAVQRLAGCSSREWHLLESFFDEHPAEAPSQLLDRVARPDEECPSGPPKSGPAPGFGGTGTTGMTGSNGTQMSPQGGTGGAGGPGGNATGANGDSGNDGNDCCDPLIEPGGNGGKGAAGQKMTGGKGGTGGVGGNGWWDVNIPGFAAPGGDGGPGGPGGNGTGGNGGEGGNGGRPGGEGGLGGDFGVGVAGPGGDGGPGGRGTVNGNVGSTGTNGCNANGNAGGEGNTGGQCG